MKTERKIFQRIIKIYGINKSYLASYCIYIYIYIYTYSTSQKYFTTLKCFNVLSKIIIFEETSYIPQYFYVLF